MRKSRKSKDRIDNIILITILVALLWSLYAIFKSDIDAQEKHLTKCRDQCYPNQVIEVLSRKQCVCQDPPPEAEKDGEY